MHRLAAWRRLHDAARTAFFATADRDVTSLEGQAYVRWKEIPCVVYAHTIPAPEMQIRECVENLHRKELSAPERDAHTLLLAGLLKKQGGASGSKKHNGRRAENGGGSTPSILPPAAPPPTVAQATAAELGLTAKNATQTVQAGCERPRPRSVRRSRWKRPTRTR